MRDDTALAFQNEVRPNERILWSGRPKLGITFRPSDLVVIPISLLWFGCALAWEVGAILLEAPVIFWLVGIPFVLVGLYFIFGRYIVDAQQRAKTYYALTTERIIIVSGLFRRNAKSISLETLRDMDLSKKADGTGTITFGPKHPLGWLYSGNWWPDVGQYAPLCFDMLSDAQEVFDKIRAAQ